MINLFLRAIILYVIVIVTMRLMGKRQLRQLQPYELVITIIIADLASLPMQDEKLPLIRGIIPLIALLFVQIILSVLCFKSKSVRRFINGKPITLIENGVIIQQNMKRTLTTISDILEAMHSQEISDIAQIDYAILETNGSITVFKKGEYSTLSLSDITSIDNSGTIKSSFAIPVVIDGKEVTDKPKNYNRIIKKIRNVLTTDKKEQKDILLAYSVSDNVKIIYKEK